MDLHIIIPLRKVNTIVQHGHADACKGCTHIHTGVYMYRMSVAEYCTTTQCNDIESTSNANVYQSTSYIKEFKN